MPRKTPSDPAPSKAHQDDLLDEALDESFPASDPPSMTEPKAHPDPGKAKPAPKSR